MEFVKLFSMYGMKLEEASGMGKVGNCERGMKVIGICPYLNHPTVWCMCDDYKRCDGKITLTAVLGMLQIVCPLC